MILISEWAGPVGEVQRSEQAEVRTQEREAECNRGRTTCRPAWDVPIGSSRSGGPESPPAGPACVFWGVGEMKRYQACVKNRRHPLRFADRGLWTIVFNSSVLAFEMETNLPIFAARPWRRPSLTSAWSAASGSHCAPGSPPPPLPRGTGGPSPSSPWPRSAGWIPPLQMGYWPGNKKKMKPLKIIKLSTVINDNPL